MQSGRRSLLRADGSRSFVRFTDVAAYGSRAFKGTMRRKEQVMNSVWPARSKTFWRRHSTRGDPKSFLPANLMAVTRSSRLIVYLQRSRKARPDRRHGF